MADSPSTATATNHQSPTKLDVKTSLSLSITRKTRAFGYGFTFLFVACTFFLVFSPSGYSSPWINNLFRTNSAEGSQFSSVFSHFFPISTQTTNSPPPFSEFANSPFQVSGKGDAFVGSNAESRSEESKLNVLNETGNFHSSDSLPAHKVDLSPQSSHTLSQNSTVQISQEKEVSWKMGGINGSNINPQFNESLNINMTNQPVISQSLPSVSRNGNAGENPNALKVQNGKELEDVLQVNETEEGVLDKEKMFGNATLVSKGSETNGNVKELLTKGREENWLEMMSQCNLYDGRWVKDDSYPLYAPGSCPHIDEPFNCYLNGRPDNGYEKYKWQPKDCIIPRLNGMNMLELLRGKRLVFIGDSLNRNMWESLVCVLRSSVEDKGRVFEASGRHEFRTEGSYSFIFIDYNCSVEYFRSPFLVQEWEMPDANGSKKETLRLDMIERSSDRYKAADVLIFNTGHWWTHEKTSKGKGYYQEGSHIYAELNVKEAYRKALTTWARWVDTNVDPKKTVVLFRGYSAAHFRGGRWNSGGQCNVETEPIKNEIRSSKYRPKMKILESVIKEMNTPVIYLNITKMTKYRKDAHPSVYRTQNLTKEERESPLRSQDCSHWCLPGVPETWNAFVYAELLLKYTQRPRQTASRTTAIEDK